MNKAQKTQFSKRRHLGVYDTPPYFINKIFFRPNNYRRKTQIRGMGKKNPNHTPPYLYKLKKKYGVQPHPQNKNIYVKFDNITVVVSRNWITSIYEQPKERGYKLIYEFTGSHKEIKEKVEQKQKEIKGEIDKRLLEVSRGMGLNINPKSIEWVRHEDFIKGEDFIDKIPEDIVIHDTAFKKVYKKGIEFIGKEPTGLKQYLKNKSVEDDAEKIIKEIQEVKEEINASHEIKVLKKAVLRLIEALENYIK